MTDTRVTDTPMTDTRPTDMRLVLTTVARRDEAERMARTLVEERLAACVNLLPGVHSIYHWNQAVESADEVLLLIKTTEAALDALGTRLHQLHNYEVPEFLVLSVESGSAAYLAWVAAGVRNGLVF